jgi:hypothetical protein
MNKKQTNHLSSYLAVNFVFSKYETKVAALPALLATVTKYRGLMNELDSVRLIQEGHTTGTTLQKQKEEAEMIEATVRIAAAVYLYAKEQNNLELQEQVNVSPTYLQRLGDSKLVSHCTLIYNLANGLDAEALVPYGVLPETIGGLKKEIDDFAALVAKPRTQIVARSTATNRMKELFKEISDLLLDELDKLMLLLKNQEPVFYNEYRAARIIVDLRGAYETEEPEEDGIE